MSDKSSLNGAASAPVLIPVTTVKSGRSPLALQRIQNALLDSPIE